MQCIPKSDSIEDCLWLSFFYWTQCIYTIFKLDGNSEPTIIVMHGELKTVMMSKVKFQVHGVNICLFIDR